VEAGHKPKSTMEKESSRAVSAAMPPKRASKPAAQCCLVRLLPGFQNERRSTSRVDVGSSPRGPGGQTKLYCLLLRPLRTTNAYFLLSFFFFQGNAPKGTAGRCWVEGSANPPNKTRNLPKYKENHEKKKFKKKKLTEKIRTNSAPTINQKNGRSGHDPTPINRRRSGNAKEKTKKQKKKKKNKKKNKKKKKKKKKKKNQKKKQEKKKNKIVENLTLRGGVPPAGMFLNGRRQCKQVRPRLPRIVSGAPSRRRVWGGLQKPRTKKKKSPTLL